MCLVLMKPLLVQVREGRLLNTTDVPEKTYEPVNVLAIGRLINFLLQFTKSGLRKFRFGRSRSLLLAFNKLVQMHRQKSLKPGFKRIDAKFFQRRRWRYIWRQRGALIPRFELPKCVFPGPSGQGVRHRGLDREEFSLALPFEIEALSRRDNGHDLRELAADAVNKPVALKDYLAEGFILRHQLARFREFLKAPGGVKQFFYKVSGSLWRVFGDVIADFVEPFLGARRPNYLRHFLIFSN